MSKSLSGKSPGPVSRPGSEADFLATVRLVTSAATILLASAIIGVLLSANWCVAQAAPGQPRQTPTTDSQVLDGPWKLAIDPENKGRTEKWFARIMPEARDAPVPGIIQQVFPAYHGLAWYWHSFRVRLKTDPRDRILLHFGAVDYQGEVWVNGKRAGSYEGGETPFEFDITGLVKADADNLLAVRVLNPTDVPIDGYILDQIPHRNKTMTPTAGAAYNSGGIIYPVELHAVPPVYVTDLFALPDWKSGTISITAKVHNSAGKQSKGKFTVQAAQPGEEGRVFLSQEARAKLSPGDSASELSFTISQPRLWNLDDPFLYRVTVRLDVPGQRPSQQSVRCGFRDFRVVDGYFQLNGNRIFLKSTHSGNGTPIGQQLAVIPDHVRRDLISAKASGFNAVRFLSGVPWPVQLDFCDDIGLMVIEESYASWLLGYASYHTNVQPRPALGYSKIIEDRSDHNTTEMILRDRNHPSVVAWGLLNETDDGPIFKHAVEFLPELRKLDPARLVILSSGRWDRHFEIGSVSNPGGNTWEQVWGVESANPPKPQSEVGHPSRDGAGDFHLYPVVPHTPETLAYIRNLGRDTKPVFLSEYGIGSLFDVISEWRHFEQVSLRPDLEDASSVREQNEKLYADWKRLGLENVYPFPEDMLRESQRLSARQRTLGFNLIRSNPKICGFNLTGMLDHGMCGEGLWKFWREWKPEMFDAVCDGWDPLRWCLFADPMHGYVGRDLTVEAVLATEDALKPGEYPARFRVFGPTGTVWEKSATVTIPSSLPFAVPVLRETFKLKGPPGQYTFSANLERGGAATGGSLTFNLSNPEESPRLSGEVTLWGIGEKTKQWLTAHGLECRPFQTNEEGERQLILVGMPADAGDANQWELLKRRMTVQGANVVFLKAGLFKGNTNNMNWLPLKAHGTCINVYDWLYHKECVAQRHPVFQGLQGPGIMDMEYYGPVIPHEIFIDQDTPDETICAGFNTGYHAVAGAYRSSLLIALYRAGAGRFVLSTPYILENLDSHPAADRLLLNLLRYLSAAGDAPLGFSK